jgi:hypothetical protein
VLRERKAKAKASVEVEGRGRHVGSTCADSAGQHEEIQDERWCTDLAATVLFLS